MKLSLLTTLLAVCLLAFASNVNSKSIDVDSIETDDSNSVEIIVNVEGSGSESPESAESTTEAAGETTAEPEEDPSTPVPDISVNIEEINQFIRDLMNKVEHIMESVIDSVSEGKPLNIRPQRPHRHHHNFRPQQPEEFDHEGNPVPIQPRTFKTLSWLLRSILKTLRGINCSIKGVVNVKQSTEQILNEFQSCGVEATKQIQAVVDSAQKTLDIANDIININENVCENPDYLSEDVDASAKASSKCAKQLRSKIVNLDSQINTTTKLIKKVPSDAGDCVNTSFSTYQAAIVDFPNFVKACAKL